LLYEEGYNDAKVNQWYLDNILQKKWVSVYLLL
jgi:hypothetical protein